MTWVQESLRDAPLGLWLLDDATPFQDYSGRSRAGSHSGTLTKHAPVVAGATYAPLFSSTVSGTFASPVFIQGKEAQPFTLEASVRAISTTAPTNTHKILSHASAQDGLVINGTKVAFVTKYLTAPEARAEYDLQVARTVHLIGVHTREKNSLYVDGVLVAEANITEAQQADQFVATDGNLYTGSPSGTESLAVNGIGIYGSALSADAALRHYTYARKTVSSDGVATSYGGVKIPLSKSMADIFLQQTWATATDWRMGIMEGTAVQDDRLVPQLENDVSIAGEWRDNFAMSFANTTSIFGVNFNWDGEGATISASLDGTTWETVERGKNIALIAPGYNPTDKELLIRISFPGGIANDTSYVDNLEVTGLRSGVMPEVEGRTVTLTGAAYLENDRPLMNLDDNWGVELRGGTLTIGAETTEDAVAPQTLEIWAKGAFSTNISGTNVRTNGAGAVTPVNGQWQMRTYIVPAGHTGDITITGANAQIGQVVLYDTQLTDAQILAVFSAYTGVPVTRAGDNSVIVVTESPEASKIYAYDWTIQGAG